MDTYKTIVLKELYEQSHVHPWSLTKTGNPSTRMGEVFIKDISQTNGFTVPLVKNAISALRKLKAIYVEPNHDINDLDKMMSFILRLNNPICDFLKEDQGGCHNAK